MKIYRLIVLMESIEYFAYTMLSSILLYSIFHIDFGLALGQSAIYLSAFVSVLYCFIALGGLIGDRLIGNQLALIVGMLLVVMGYLSVTMMGLYFNEIVSIYKFFIPLSLISLGTGMFKSNSSKIFADFVEDDQCLNTKFIYFLISINCGAFIGGFFAPFIRQWLSWEMVTLICFIVTLVSWVTIMLVLRAKKTFSLKLEQTSFTSVIIGIITICLLPMLGALIIYHSNYAIYFQTFVLVALLIFFIKKILELNSSMKKIFFYLFLVFLTIAVSFIVSQRTISVNTFTILCSDHKILGFNIPPESFQSLDAIWIILVGPICVLLMRFNTTKLLGKYLNNIIVGVICCIFGYLLLYLVSMFHNSVISGNWILIYQFLMAITELFIASTGLSVICNFMPSGLKAIAIGLFFVMLSYGYLLSGYLIKDSLGGNTQTAQLNILMQNYSHIFGYFTLVGICVLIAAIMGKIVIHRQLYDL